MRMWWGIIGFVLGIVTGAIGMAIAILNDGATAKPPIYRNPEETRTDLQMEPAQHFRRA